MVQILPDLLNTKKIERIDYRKEWREFQCIYLSNICLYARIFTWNASNTSSGAEVPK